MDVKQCNKQFNKYIDSLGISIDLGMTMNSNTQIDLSMECTCSLLDQIIDNKTQEILYNIDCV